MGDIINSLFPEDKSKKGVKVNGKQRKYIVWLVSVAIIGVLAMSLANLTNNKQAELPVVPNTKGSENPQPHSNSTLTIAEQSMEGGLKNIIGQIAGVGEVDVEVTLEASPEYQYAMNSQEGKTEVNEQAQDGSTRTTSETRTDAQLVMKSMTQGQDEPVVVKEIRPEVVGVMIVAQGASDLVVKEQISEAVQTLLNIPAHRVTVLPKGE